MDKEKPTDDPRNKTDWTTTKQSEEPWAQPVEKEQKPDGARKPDLEKWHESDTH